MPYNGPYFRFDPETHELTEVYGIDKACDNFCENIKTLFADATDTVKRCQKELDELRKEKWRDEELQKMKAERDAAIADMRRGFEITLEDRDAINRWKRKHEDEHHGGSGKMRGGAIGGSYRYEFVPTSIGTIGTIICSNCKNKAYRDAGNPKKYKTFWEWNNAVKEATEKYDAEFTFCELT